MIDADTGTNEHRSERVASNDSSGQGDEAVEGSWSPRRPKASSTRTAAARAAGEAKGKGGASPDPEALVEDIEHTREELAETLDAIADKVSPKRVAGRTKKKVGDAVKEGTHDAAESVKSAASGAAEAVKGGVAAVKEKASGDTDPVAAPASTPGALADAAVTPVEPAGSELPSYSTTSVAAPPASRAPMLAGAAAALLVVLFVMRRRRR